MGSGVGEALLFMLDPTPLLGSLTFAVVGRGRLDVNWQRGVLLGVVALRDGEPFQKITTVEIAFDGPIPEERFTLWHVTCLFREASQRPPWPGSVALIYRSDDGHDGVSLSQFPRPISLL